MMKKVCIVTATRAEYGLLRWTIEALRREPSIETCLVVTGTHLLEEYGMTADLIEADGIKIDVRLPYQIYTGADAIGRTMASCAEAFAGLFAGMKPDLLLVLGDRYELLPICSCALVERIPIAHIAGGDVTEGAVDDEIRNAITMMSTLHFPSVKDSYDNVVRMRGSDEGVFAVGEPGIENFKRMALMSREELASALGLDPSRRWIMATLHPETMLPLEDNMKMTKAFFEALESLENAEIVVSSANADTGGAEMNEYIKALDGIHFFPSLGQIKYLSLLAQAWCVAGNSSSGILETPILGVPTINVGDRQKGRHVCSNVICCGRDRESICEALNSVKGPVTPDEYFGDGEFSSKVVKHIKEYFDE